MPVLMVRIVDRHKNMQLSEQTDQTHRYPVLISGCVHNIRGQALIERWVDVIKKKAQ
jgi:hypothetical protein